MALDNGKLSLEDYGKLSLYTLKNFSEAAGVLAEIKGPSAILKGSKEEATLFVQQMNNQGLANNPAEILRRATAQSNELQRQQLDVQKQMLQVLGKDKSGKEI